MIRGPFAGIRMFSLNSTKGRKHIEKSAALDFQKISDWYQSKPSETMARTKQTARRSTQDEPIDEEDQNEINGTLTEEEKKRREELEKAPMQIELKHLEKRWTKKGRAYIAEPKEDEDLPEEKTNWYEKYALCVSIHFLEERGLVLTWPDHPRVQHAK